MYVHDLNQIERVEDSVDPSSLMHGSERRAWNCLSDKLDLLDNRLIMVEKTSPHFTRQALHGDRFDQSKSDRTSYSD